MKEQEASVNSITEQKAKIRLRYQGIDPNLLVVLPAKTETGLYDDTVHRRVAVYARVSTDDPHQTSSYELQNLRSNDSLQRWILSYREENWMTMIRFSLNLTTEQQAYSGPHR